MSWVAGHKHRTGWENSIISITLSQCKTGEAFDFFTPKGVIIHQKEKPGRNSKKEEKMQKGLQKEATVLGTIQILFCLVIASLGTILVSVSYSSYFNPAVSTISMSGYPFLGALCFAFTGCLSIVSGRKSTKPFKKMSVSSSGLKSTISIGVIKKTLEAGENESNREALSSLTLNAVSAVAAGTGLLFLSHSLVALGPASRQCRSEKDHLSALPYSEYYYSIYEIKDCLLDGVSLTGVLLVMLLFTALELFVAVYASILWSTRLYSIGAGNACFLSRSQDHVQQVKKNSSKSWV